MRFALLLFATLPLYAQNVGLSVSPCIPVQAKAGTPVACDITTTGPGTVFPVAFDWVVSVTQGTTAVPWTITTAASSKQIYSAPATTGIVVLLGINQTVIGSGSTVATIHFTMPNGNASIMLTGAAAVDASGGVITVTTNPPQSIQLQSNCDENNDGTVNQADVTIAVQNLLTGTTGAAALGTGLSNAQKDANAITGVCTR